MPFDLSSAKPVGAGNFDLASAKPVGVADVQRQMAEDTGPLDAALIGAGRVTDRVLSGVKQALLGGWLPESMQGPYTKAKLAELKAEQTDNTARYEPLAEAHPVATTAGEVFATLPAGIGATGYRAAIAAGALPGLLEYGTAGEKAVGGGAGAVGGALGQALGDLVYRLAVRRGAAPLADAERAELVRQAQELGYNLRPDQITGKNWQKNLAAALQQNPATSGMMEKSAAGQQANTDRLVKGALWGAGGEIDQASAGAAAHTGIVKGLEREAATIDDAYRAVLDGREVNLEAVRPAFEAIKAAQQRLPEANQGGPALKAIGELLGDANYGQKQARAFTRPGVNPAEDDVIVAIRKLGGITPEDEAVGSLAKANPFPNDPRLGAVWRRPTYTHGASSNTTAGHSLDRMAELLQQHGYPVNGPDDVMNAIADATMGAKPMRSTAFDHGAAAMNEDPLVQEIRGLRGDLSEANRPPPARAGYIRDNPQVPGELAQDLRSDYGVKSEAAFAHSKNAEGKAWAQMRGVIDSAIEEALPEAEKQQFAAVNERYGLGQAVKLLKDRDQQTLLRQIYRGFNSEDEFAHFIAMSPDKEFREVARGFLSDLVDKARDKAGNISAERLGRATRDADPEAKRLLGGDSAALLEKVGQIGERLLPDMPNSQTANRAMFLRALSNPLSLAGGLGGGAAGGNEHGAAGAAGGAALGAFLLPKAVGKVYLSDLAKQFLTRAPREGVPGLRDLSPELRGYLADLLRGVSIGSGAAATD